MTIEDRSPRLVALEALVEAARTVSAGRYEVRRGAVNWAGFDFSRHRSAIAVIVDEGELDMSEKDYQVAISLEIFGRAAAGEFGELNDLVMEQFFQDGMQILRTLQAAKNKSGEGATIAVLPKWRWTEVSDAQRAVQGIIWQFNVKL